MKKQISLIGLAIISLLTVLFVHLWQPNPSYSTESDRTMMLATTRTASPESSAAEERAQEQVSQIAQNRGEDSPCFYRKPDGTVVDLRKICRETDNGVMPSGAVPGNSNAAMTNRLTNPAMQITPANDPGVLYLSNSGDSAPIAAASAAEWHPRH
ncbi:MAG: hypothetical protein B0A82_23105 [Alkalinema sp. CACIAM 70d]|nr:MAG: hypothetical protein B0A82_23105 [Alkalinema sp. CACIAM 70d]